MVLRGEVLIGWCLEAGSELKPMFVLSSFFKRNVEMSLDCTPVRCQVFAGFVFFFTFYFWFVFFKCSVSNKAK